MRHFFIEQPEVNRPTSLIFGPDARHIANVLRLKPGDTIGLFDGRGVDYEARIVDVAPGRVEVAIIRGFPSTAESPVKITVAQGYLKDKKMDGLIRQVTELGITRWIPFTAERSVPRPDEKRLSARTERWKKIAKEALKQCKRGRMTEVGKTASYEDVLKIGQTCDLKIAFWENETKPMGSILKPVSGRRFDNIFVMMGPEGGFTTQEIERARNCGFVTAALGPRILRAETATLAACTLLQYLFGDMGQKNLDKNTVY